jgi:hypothetical protein|tara:strand:+ start:445 stop:774 length:330 start_codon:yes stop_codon:yes gene_type:complete
MGRYPEDIDRRIKELEREQQRRGEETKRQKDREMYVTLEDHLEWFMRRQMGVLARFEVLFREAGDDHESLMAASEALLLVTEVHKNSPPAISDKYKEELVKVTEEMEAE